MNSPSILKCDGISKSYSGKKIFEKLSFEFGNGVVALTGENGAGKSTLIESIAGVTLLDQGVVQICGMDINVNRVASRKELSFVPDECIAYEFLTGIDFLHLVCALRQISITAEDNSLHEQIDLSAHLEKKVSEISLGTRKKLMLASGLLGKASLILMDEPTNGLDAGAKSIIAEQIKNRGREALVLFSTHDKEFIQLTGADTISLGSF